MIPRNVLRRLFQEVDEGWSGRSQEEDGLLEEIQDLITRERRAEIRDQIISLTYRLGNFASEGNQKAHLQLLAMLTYYTDFGDHPTIRGGQIEDAYSQCGFDKLQQLGECL